MSPIALDRLGAAAPQPDLAAPAVGRIAPGARVDLAPLRATAAPALPAVAGGLIGLLDRFTAPQIADPARLAPETLADALAEARSAVLARNAADDPLLPLTLAALEIEIATLGLLRSARATVTGR